MFEPTETEPREMLDYAADSLREIFNRTAENPDSIKNSPKKTRIGRPDEVKAARKPVVRYEFPEV